MFQTLVNGKNKLVEILASFVSYDNTASGLTATDVQAAIDEIAAEDDCIDGGLANSVFRPEDCFDGGDANG